MANCAKIIVRQIIPASPDSFTVWAVWEIENVLAVTESTVLVRFERIPCWMLIEECARTQFHDGECRADAKCPLLVPAIPGHYDHYVPFGQGEIDKAIFLGIEYGSHLTKELWRPKAASALALRQQQRRKVQGIGG